MLLTSFAFITVFITILPFLRNGWFVLYSAICVISSFLLEQDIKMEIFSNLAIQNFIIIHLITINFVTYLAYFFDKKSAKKNKWRIPEKTLHSFAIIGGTPAAFIAIRTLRHKNRKSSFKQKFLAVIILQIVVLLSIYWFIQ